MSPSLPLFDVDVMVGLIEERVDDADAAAVIESVDVGTRVALDIGEEAIDPEADPLEPPDPAPAPAPAPPAP